MMPIDIKRCIELGIIQGPAKVFVESCIPKATYASKRSRIITNSMHIRLIFSLLTLRLPCSREIYKHCFFP